LFPWSTFLVNVVGSFVMGALIAWLTSRAQEPLHESARLFLATGVLGGFTTFSAFSLDAVALWERGDTGFALAYVAASVVLSIAGLVAGLTLARSLAG
jgi:CrcB protein